MSRRVSSRALLLFFLMQGLLSCLREEVAALPSSEPVNLPLAMSFSTEKASTKMSDEATIASSGLSFPGVESLILVPFQTANNQEIQSNDAVWGSVLEMGAISSDISGTSAQGGAFPGLVSGINAHLYDRAALKRNANYVAVYGKAVPHSAAAASSTPMKAKKLSGSLVAPDFTSIQTAADVSFQPEPFLSGWNAAGTQLLTDEFKSWKTALVNSTLNQIMRCAVNQAGKTYYFRDPDSFHHHPVLEAALRAFVNDGEVIPASDEQLNPRLTALYRAVYPLTLSQEASADYRDGSYYYIYELAKDVIKNISNRATLQLSGSGQNTQVKLIHPGPSSFGLPFGSYAVQFQNGNKMFSSDVNNASAQQGVGVFMAGADEFCYPSALYYFVDSPLRTSATNGVESHYTSSAGTWSNIIQLYPNTQVQSDSKSAAVEKPLQFASARLRFSLQRVTNSSGSLKDAQGNDISVANRNFPLTGILVAGQRTVDHNFHPLSGKNVPERVMYDSEVNTSAGKTRAYITSYANSSEDISTLVLESEPGKDIHFALEFQNNQAPFYGINGVLVDKGMHFYLLGAMKLAEASNPGSLSSVLMQDRVTTVHVSITSLENAHIVLPDLRQPQLIVGVSAIFDWDMEQPFNYPIR